MESGKRRRVESDLEQRPVEQDEIDVNQALRDLTNGWDLKACKSHEWQLFPLRLAEIIEMEKDDAALSSAIVAEKNELFKKGFPHWTRKDFSLFMKGLMEKGVNLSAGHLKNLLPDKTPEELEMYLNQFWQTGALCFTPENWLAVCSIVNASQAPINRSEIIAEIKRRLAQGLPVVGPPRTTTLPQWTEYCYEEDLFLLASSMENLSFVDLREAMLRSIVFEFDHFFRSRNLKELSQRTDFLWSELKREMEEQSKANVKMARDRERRDQEDILLQQREQEILRKIEELERPSVSGNQSVSVSPEASPSREVQLDDNANQIPGSPHSSQEEENEMGGDEPVLAPAYREFVLNNVLKAGSCGMAQLLERIMRLLPDGLISKRQLRREITLLAVKEKRAGDRAAKWYARNAD